MLQLLTMAALLIAFTSALSAQNIGMPSVPELAAATEKRAVLDAGNPDRLARLFARAERGEPLVLGFIGGSITAGAAATNPNLRYTNLVTQWWRTRFPKSLFTLINAGVGATGSDYGCLRIERDLLVRKPDLVIVDFAVNDDDNERSARTYEGLLRQILAAPQQPAVLLVMMSRQNGANVQRWHSQVGRHYQLPMISYRDGIWPEIESGKLQWRDISPDATHPNDIGHSLLAAYITRFLSSQQASVKLTETLQPLPAPLFTDLFAHTALYEAADLHPTANKGWEYDPSKKCWKSSQPGSTVHLTLQGRELSLMFWRLHAGMGKARVQVDDLPAMTLDAWFELTWGGYRQTSVIAQNLSTGPHNITVELLDEKNPQSEGYEFRLMGFGAAGVSE